jgi:hypothetical protein
MHGLQLDQWIYRGISAREVVAEAMVFQKSQDLGNLLLFPNLGPAGKQNSLNRMDAIPYPFQQFHSWQPKIHSQKIYRSIQKFG